MKKSTSKPRSSGAVSKVAKDQSVDLDLLERVSSFMRENGIVELEVRSGGSEIKLRRAASNGNGAGAVPPYAYALGAMAAAPVPAPAAPVAEAKPAAPSPAPVPDKKYHVVTSPFVGTFYRASGPNQEPFVEVGKIVNPGNTLCIIEAMKLMNEIESDAKGRVVRVVVQNGTPVEYGDPLFEIEPL